MNQNEKFYTWKKGESFPINKYFDCHEFTCQCKHPECVDQIISVDLIKKLTALREDLKKPISIPSGYRCSAHQKDVAASGVSTVVAKKSQHEVGEAADCSFSGYTTDTVYPFAQKYFKAIGIAETFLHLDTRSDKERRWYY